VESRDFPSQAFTRRKNLGFSHSHPHTHMTALPSGKNLPPDRDAHAGGG